MERFPNKSFERGVASLAQPGDESWRRLVPPQSSAVKEAKEVSMVSSCSRGDCGVNAAPDVSVEGLTSGRDVSGPSVLWLLVEDLAQDAIEARPRVGEADGDTEGTWAEFAVPANGSRHTPGREMTFSDPTDNTSSLFKSLSESALTGTMKISPPKLMTAEEFQAAERGTCESRNVLIFVYLSSR